jgi:hypothetical protein
MDFQICMFEICQSDYSNLIIWYFINSGYICLSSSISWSIYSKRGTQTNVTNINKTPNNRTLEISRQYSFNLWWKKKHRQNIGQVQQTTNHIKFTIEKELHNSINFYDPSIHPRENEIEFTIYRKPTQTDIIIPNDSCHPCENKMSSINYLVNRLNFYPVSKETKEVELNIIRNTIHNNKYNINIEMCILIYQQSCTKMEKSESTQCNRMLQ